MQLTIIVVSTDRRRGGGGGVSFTAVVENRCGLSRVREKGPSGSRNSIEFARVYSVPDRPGRATVAAVRQHATRFGLSIHR